MTLVAPDRDPLSRRRKPYPENRFERLPAETLHRVKNLDDGDEYDLDAVIGELIDRRAGQTP